MFCLNPLMLIFCLALTLLFAAKVFRPTSPAAMMVVQVRCARQAVRQEVK